MPTPLIKAFSKQSGKSKKDVERYWDEAKEAAKKKFKKKTDDFWAYVNAITQRRAGLRHSGVREQLSFRTFITEGAPDWLSKYKKYDPAEVKPFSKETAESVYIVKGSGKHVIFDNHNGIGSVPWNRNVKYQGFIIMLKPSQFLKIVDDDHGVQDERASQVEAAIEQNYGLGTPFLTMKFSGEFPEITNHEGRGRMKAIKKAIGDVAIPVHVFGWHLRAADVDDEFIKRLHGRVISERGETLVGGDYFKDIVK